MDQEGLSIDLSCIVHTVTILSLMVFPSIAVNLQASGRPFPSGKTDPSWRQRHPVVRSRQEQQHHRNPDAVPEVLGEGSKDMQD